MIGFTALSLRGKAKTKEAKNKKSPTNQWFVGLFRLSPFHIEAMKKPFFDIAA